MAANKSELRVQLNFSHITFYECIFKVINLKYLTLEAFYFLWIQNIFKCK